MRKYGIGESIGRDGVVLRTMEKRREKAGQKWSREWLMAWGWSSGLGRTGSGRCAQIRLETGGDACFGHGEAFVAVTGGEKVHHGNLVEVVMPDSEILHVGAGLFSTSLNYP